MSSDNEAHGDEDEIEFEANERNRRYAEEQEDLINQRTGLGHNIDPLIERGIDAQVMFIPLAYVRRDYDSL